MIYGFESSASSVLTSQRGHWALPGIQGKDLSMVYKNCKGQRNNEELIASRLWGTLQGRCSSFYNRLKKMERKGEHLD